VELKRRRIRQSDEVSIRNFQEIDRTARGPLAASRHHQHQPVFAESKPLEIFRQSMLGRKAEVGHPACDRGGNVGAFALLDIEADIGMFAQESRKCLRQMFC